MDPLAISTLIVFCTVGGAALGLWLKRVLPDHHVDDKSKDVVRVSMGLVVTMASLLLSLAISSAKTSFTGAETALRQSALEITQLNTYLKLYGPETVAIRRALQQLVAGPAIQLWPELERKVHYEKNDRPGSTVLAREILALKPATEYQSWLKAQALAIVTAQLQQGALIAVPPGEAAKLPFVVLLCVWLVLIFLSFGLFAPSHITGQLAILSGAVSVAAAVYLILELEHPYGGWIRVSPDPILHALSQIAH